MKKVSLSKLALVTATVAGILILALLSNLLFTRNVHVYNARTPLRAVPICAYDMTPVENPDAPTGISNRYTWTIGPSPAHGTNLGIYTFHQYVRVYVNGEELLRLDNARDDQMVHTPGANWCFFPIYQEDAGKEICIEIIPCYESAIDRDPLIYMGTIQDIFLLTAQREFPQLILSGLNVIVGLIFLIVGMFNYFTHGKGKTLIAHGLFSIMLGIWKLADLRTASMLLPNQTVQLYYFSVCMLSLCSVPLIKALSRRVGRICAHLLNACCILCASVCIIQHTLQILNILDMRQMLTCTHISMGISAAIAVPALIYDSIKFPKPIKEQHNKALLFICVPGAIIDIVLFYFSGDSARLSFTLAAHLIYVIVVGTHTLVRANRQEMEIERSRTAVMRSQIQPHFLFNSLTAIAMLCEKDPSLAKQTAITFADYYRGNLRAIDRTEPIPFRQELEHLKMYLFIQKQRFGDYLNVVFDVETTDFLIPALSIQPLVENAVKHGIGVKEDGGTVTITVREYADNYKIIISDDGVGFDPNSIDNRERQHVGLENVKNRLLLMCNATLSIESVVGKGTAITISLPKAGVDQ